MVMSNPQDPRADCSVKAAARLAHGALAAVHLKSQQLLGRPGEVVWRLFRFHRQLAIAVLDWICATC